MNSLTLAFSSLLLLSLSPTKSFSDSRVILTPQKVVDRLLSQGFEKQTIDFQRSIDSKGYYDALGYFDFGIEAKTSYEHEKVEPLGPFENEKEETYSFSSKLRKALGWGSTVSMGYTRSSVKKQLNTFLSNNNSLPTQTTDYLSLELEQNLLSNFAGGIFDRRLEVQKLLETRRDEQLIEDTEKAILNGLEQFWQSYAANENLKAAIETRDRYQKLVKTSQRKQRLGFAAPGELARVQAEFERKDQNVKQLSADYLAEIDKMFLQLGVEAPSNVQFEIGGDPIPDLPSMQPINVENVRRYKIQRLLTKTWEVNQKIVKSEQTPKLDLVARLSYRGADEQASEAASDLGGLNSPTYFVGLTFQSTLGSSGPKGARAKAAAEFHLSQLQLVKTKMQAEDLIQQTQRQVSAYYKIALSARSGLQLRQKALKEIESAYSQGRLDVSHVIEAFNQLLTAKTQMTGSIGNYHVWRNALASYRDELILRYVELPKKSDGDL